MRLALAIVLLSTPAVSTHASEELPEPADEPARTAPKCFDYVSPVTLSGRVFFRTFTDAMLRPERVALLLLDEPICVKGVGDPDNVDVGGQVLIHLDVAPGQLPENARTAGHRFTATGTFRGAVTGHHHAPLLLDVTDLKGGAIKGH